MISRQDKYFILYNPKVLFTTLSEWSFYLLVILLISLSLQACNVYFPPVDGALY